MVGETEIRKAFSLSLNGTTVEPGCIYGGPDEAPHLDLVQEEPGKEIFWIKNGGVYVAARNIVSGVSWTDLYVNGWVLGRELELDGRAYLCRLMEVGETADRYCEYERLLAFVALDHARTNSLSWGREQTGEKMAAARGGSGCKNWCSLPYDNRSGACGWRPILEPIMLVLNDASIGQDIEVRKLGSNIVVCGKLLHFTDYDLIIEVDRFVWPSLDWGKEIDPGIWALDRSQLGYMSYI